MFRCAKIIHSGADLGQFIFPKDVLLKPGVLPKDGLGRLRATRVYQDIADSAQSKKTQTWQLHYFVELQSQISLECLERLLK